MKVIHIISSFAAGGAEIFVKNLSLELSKKIEVEVWALSKSKNKIFEKEMREELEKNNVETEILGKRGKKDRLKTYIKLRKLIKESNVDILHTHLEHVSFHVIITTIGLKVPIIQTIHSNKIYYPYIGSYFMKYFVDKYIAISEKNKKIVKNFIKLKENKIKLIYNGINMNEFTFKKRIIKDKVRNIISIGRLEEVKNHKLLIKAFKILIKKLKRENYEIPRLNIVGDGSLRNSLEDLVDKLDLKKHVNFLGIRNDIPALLKKNDLYVMTSKWEGLSISLIEALASGIPIIATNVGSNDEIIENNTNGKLINSNSEEILAKEIMKLIKNKSKRCKYSRNALKKIKKFSIKNTVSKYYKTYMQINRNNNLY